MAYRAQRPNGKQRVKMRWFAHMASDGDVHGLGNGGERVWAKELINRRLAVLKAEGFWLCLGDTSLGLLG